MSIQDETREEVEKLQTENEAESETAPTTEEGETAAPAQEEESNAVDGSPGAPELPASAQKRIDELTYKYKSEREARLKMEEEFKKSRANPAQPTSEEAQREQSAREYLKGLYQEIIKEQKSEEEAADKALQDECEHIAALYPDFKKEEVLKVMDKYGIDEVERAYLAWKEMGRVVEKTKEDTKKEILAKPKSPSSVKTQDGVGSKFSDEDISKLSIHELAERAKREAGF